MPFCSRPDVLLYWVSRVSLHYICSKCNALHLPTSLPPGCATRQHSRTGTQHLTQKHSLEHRYAQGTSQVCTY